MVRLTAVMEQKALSAPFDGIIGIPQIEVGEYVQPGTVYATLQDLDTMRVDFSVPEQQIRLIEIGMPLTASTEVGGTDRHRQDRRDRAADRPELPAGARPRRGRHQGRHDQPGPVPARPRRAADRGRRDRAAADGAHLDPLRRLGLRRAHRAPPEAPQPESTGEGQASAEGQPEAEGEADQPALTVEQVFVKAGRRSEGLVEIVEGVKAGDQVVTAGQNRLTGGARSRSTTASTRCPR